MDGKPLTVDCSQYSMTTETYSDTYTPNVFDAERAAGKDFEYLLKILGFGHLFCKSRGKLLAMAAGHVSSNFILYRYPPDFTGITASRSYAVRAGVQHHRNANEDI
jgi:hypothetical protein